MNSLVIAALSCTVGLMSIVDSRAANSVRACSAGEVAACTRLEARLETVFADGNEADRQIGHELASAAVRVIGDGTLETVRQCAINETGACERVLRVLLGLFTGADAQLDASADRPLARAIAIRVSAIVTADARR